MSIEDFLPPGEPRAMEYPLIQSPKYAILAVILYLSMVVLGPRIMKNRNALQLRGVLIGYNAFTVAFSFWMTWEFVASSLLNPKFDFFCEDVIASDRSPLTLRLINVHWWYYFSKYIEFTDTLFFVLRKKTNQISFLHVFHHASMLLLQWCLFRYLPGAVSYFGPMLNCFIHTLMYAYYFLSSFGPAMQKYLWWKKYLTSMQMMQFILIVVQGLCAAKLCRFEPRHPKPEYFLYAHVIYLTSLFLLFHHFYRGAYKGKAELKTNGKTYSNTNGHALLHNGKLD